MDRATQTLLADVAIGCVAGLVATKVYGHVQEALYRPMPRDVKRREEKVRPGPPSQVAASRMAESLGNPLDEHERELAGCTLHYGVGIGWGPVYGLLRRHGGMPPVAAGALTGASLWLILDEGVVPALGFSAPNRDYPALTHIRGLLNHLAYGTAVAITAEALFRLTDMGPNSGERMNRA
jgi:uncharacterized membrane protein YagU involved in acid resistance